MINTENSIGNIGKKAEAKEYMFEVMKLKAARDMTEHK